MNVCVYVRVEKRNASDIGAADMLYRVYRIKIEINSASHYLIRENTSIRSLIVYQSIVITGGATRNYRK